MLKRRQLFSSCLMTIMATLLFCLNAGAQNTTPDSTKLITGDIVLIGNKITKSSVILRELTFHKGDTISTADIPQLIRRSEENLQNTSLFNNVHITWLQDGFKANIYVLVAERWYIFPVPVFEIAERNFNVWWQEKDFSRVIYGGILNWNNFRGRNETVAATIRLGYIQRFSFYYSFPSITRNQKTGLTLSYAYSRVHQTPVETLNNKTEYFKDSEGYSRKENGGSIVLSFRPKINVTHYVEAGFRHASVEDTVISLNENYFSEGNKTNYGILRYYLKVEHRDLAVYATKGYFFDIEAVKNGLPFLNEGVDMTYILSHYKKFFPLSSHWNFNFGVSGKYNVQGKVPYYFTKALGYGKDFIRGYEYYVIDGQNFSLLKSNIRFTLLPKHEIHAGFIPLDKFATIPYAFYINLYGDAGYVWDNQFKSGNPLVNSWQYGFGAGIDFVTYYDMVFRLEYSINKLGESGIFLHFTSSI